jgi:hypothetical protein
MNSQAIEHRAVSSSSATDRIGIERAFDVLRNHTVHTKGYVMTALKFIEEFGNPNDKASLSDLLREKDQQIPLATSVTPTPAKRKSSKKK